MAKPSDGIEGFLNELDVDTKAALSKAALSLKQKTIDQLKAGFKKRQTSNFFKQVKTYVLPAKDGLPPVAYVRLGAKFMGVFEEGTTINSEKWMIALLRTAPKQFKRITKTNPWEKVYETQLKGHSRTVTKGANSLILFKTRTGEVPVYLITKMVKEPTLLSFYLNAAKVLDEVRFD
jgi:hypothetical protein